MTVASQLCSLREVDSVHLARALCLFPLSHVDSLADGGREEGGERGRSVK